MAVGAATEPRTAALRRALAKLRPAGIEEARDALITLLADHGDSEPNGRSPVCIQGELTGRLQPCSFYMLVYLLVSEPGKTWC